LHSREYDSAEEVVAPILAAAHAEATLGFAPQE
jgi:hypothetical protein